MPLISDSQLGGGPGPASLGTAVGPAGVVCLVVSHWVLGALGSGCSGLWVSPWGSPSIRSPRRQLPRPWASCCGPAVFTRDEPGLERPRVQGSAERRSTRPGGRCCSSAGWHPCRVSLGGAEPQESGASQGPG